MPLHPNIAVRTSRIAGRGLIAKKFIPRGTIIWTYSDKEVRRYTVSQYRKFSNKYRKTLRHYAYTDYSGEIVYTLGNARFFNHSCDPNTTDALREDVAVAIRDIEPGEEVTYDYGLLMGRWEPKMKCHCKNARCRKLIGPVSHSSKIFRELMRRAKIALRDSKKVRQTMWRL